MAYLIMSYLGCNYCCKQFTRINHCLGNSMFIFQKLQAQTETFEDRPLCQEVDNIVTLEEFHAELQIESLKEHREGLELENERQEQMERVAKPDDAVSSSEKTEINQKSDSGQVGK